MKARFLLYSITLFFALWTGLLCSAAEKKPPPLKGKGKGGTKQHGLGRSTSFHDLPPGSFVNHLLKRGQRRIGQRLGLGVEGLGDVFQTPQSERDRSETDGLEGFTIGELKEVSEAALAVESASQKRKRKANLKKKLDEAKRQLSRTERLIRKADTVSLDDYVERLEKQEELTKVVDSLKGFASEASTMSKREKRILLVRNLIPEESAFTLKDIQSMIPAFFVRSHDGLLHIREQFRDIVDIIDPIIIHDLYRGELSSVVMNMTSSGELTRLQKGQGRVGIWQRTAVLKREGWSVKTALDKYYESLNLPVIEIMSMRGEYNRYLESEDFENQILSVVGTLESAFTVLDVQRHLPWTTLGPLEKIQEFLTLLSSSDALIVLSPRLGIVIRVEVFYDRGLTVEDALREFFMRDQFDMP